MNKKLFSLVMALMIVLSSVASFAAPLDLINKVDSTKDYSFTQFLNNSANFNYVAGNMGEYLIEAPNGNYYNVDQVNAALAAGAKDFAEAIIGLTAVEWPEVDEEVKPWEIRFSTTAEDDTIIANGDDNTTVVIELIDIETGKVVKANGIVVQLLTSHGSFASTGKSARVALQEGRGTIKLNSEHSATPIAAEITVKLVEATQEQKDSIGQHEFVKYVFFKPFNAGNLEAPPILVAAESNQADRVTLYFDKEVSIADFYLNNLDEDFYDNLYLTQDDGSRAYYEVIGLLPVEGNDQAIVAVLYDYDKFPLIDNMWTEVFLGQYSDYGYIENNVRFILTDARQPELVAVHTVGDSMKKLELEFSEAIHSVEEVIIDGGIVDVVSALPGEFVGGYYDVDDKVYVPGEDYRHIVYVTLADDAWFTAGRHSVTIRGAWDYAAVSDLQNRSTTQTLDFTINANTKAPTVDIVVESPEQFRITAPAGMAIDAVGSLTYGTDWAIQYKDTTVDPNVWVPVTEGVVTEIVPYKEYVLETTEDWTEHFSTDSSGINYYNRDFRLFVAKDVLVNRANGMKNTEITIPLNSIMKIEDTTSPRLVEVEQVDDFVFDIVMDEPVKGRGLDKGPAYEDLDTPSEEQGATIPTIVVEFIGTNKDGEKVTLNGATLGYGDGNGADKIITVEASDNLQTLVDTEGYDEIWTLNVKNITDDIGNAAETVVHKFEVEKSTVDPEENEFWIFDVSEDVDVDVDVLNVFVYYTDLIKTSGDEENAIKLTNYSINNQDLPKGTIVRVNTDTAVTNDDDEIIGYYGVIIQIPDADFEASTLEVAKTLISLNDNEFLGFEGYPAKTRYQETIPFHYYEP